MVSTRPIRADDLELVCRHREQMFRESDAPGRTEEILATQTAHFRPWLAKHLGDGSYFGYIVEDRGKPIAGTRRGLRNIARYQNGTAAVPATGLVGD
jgi:hypothetical protein